MTQDGYSGEFYAIAVGIHVHIHELLQQSLYM